VIAVRIDPDKKDKAKPVRDDYTRLGEYIAAAKEKGEKLDKFWIVNCGAGSELADLKTALFEIEAKRFMKPKVKNKTYHLMVSFRPGEREKLSADDLKDIERNFAEALGYTDHQRVVGTHVNTDNFHMHVAYNKIHPVTLKCVTPEKDFFALERVCRAMEKKYGLFVDKGLSDTREHDKAAQKARRFERQTWQQSFEGHLQEHKTEILAAIGGAKTWHQVHGGLAEFDAGLKKRGAGLVFHHLADPRRSMKASSLDRSCSLAALEKRLGPFELVKETAKGEEWRHRPAKRPYTAKPLFHHPGQDQLWRRYQSQQRQPGFLSRNLHIRNWKSYLLADAHKDALALAPSSSTRSFCARWRALPRLSGAERRSARLAVVVSSLPWLPPERLGTAWPSPRRRPQGGRSRKSAVPDAGRKGPGLGRARLRSARADLRYRRHVRPAEALARHRFEKAALECGRALSRPVDLNGRLRGCDQAPQRYDGTGRDYRAGKGSAGVGQGSPCQSSKSLNRHRGSREDLDGHACGTSRRHAALDH